MSQITVTANPATPVTCPSWCAVVVEPDDPDALPIGHGDPDGFHHRYVVDAVGLESLPGREQGNLEVAVSQYANAAATLDEPLVEVLGLQAYGPPTLGLLTATEARRLARWLDEAANLLDPDHPARVITAQQVLERLGELEATVASVRALEHAEAARG